MFLTSTLSDLGLADAGIVALLGYGVVFFGLILLMLVVLALGKVFAAKKAAPVQTAAPAPAAPVAPVVVPAAPVSSQPAPGTGGELLLQNVDPKTAAVCMAIVAEQTGKPLNELRFKSIKEVR